MEPKNPNIVYQHYELLKIILDFIGVVVWPCIVLVFIYTFKSQVRDFLTKARKLDLPGGFSIERMQQDIDQAKELSVEVTKERQPAIQSQITKGGAALETDANRKMVQLGLTPSPSGLNLDYYKGIIETDPRLALMGLRADLEIMVRNLATGFKVPVNKNDSASQIISKLLDRGAITSKQFQLMNSLLKIGNEAAHGTLISKKQALEVLDIAKVLVKDYTAWLTWGFEKWDE